MHHKNCSVKKYYNLAYNKAFVEYLRYGIPITVPYYVIVTKSLTGHYIWRTQEDFKVRPAHAANNGKIFERSKPPPTGHPGQSPNCRCWAEDVVATFPIEMEPFIKMNDVNT